LFLDRVKTGDPEPPSEAAIDRADFENETETAEVQTGCECALIPPRERRNETNN
jgi:hypothetical protein